MRKLYSFKEKAELLYRKAGFILSDRRGSGYIDQVLLILISVVIGALLLAGLYTLFDGTVLPTVTEKVKQLFDYKG